MVATIASQFSSDAELTALSADFEKDVDLAFSPAEWEKFERVNRFAIMKSFLAALFAPYGGRGFVELRAIQAGFPPRRYFFPVVDATGQAGKGELKEAFKWAYQQNENGFEIYCGVLPRSKRSGKKEDVAEGAWVWGDLDFKVSGREDCLLRLERAKIHPEMVVLSGNGIHAYWRLSDVAKFDSPQSVKSFEASLSAFQQIAQPGSDSVQDLPRVLRLPGFYNLKAKENPRLVALARVPYFEAVAEAGFNAN